MNKNLLHFVQIATKHKNQIDESFLDELIQASYDDQYNDRYMILLLIKIWQNNNELLGYRFKQWYELLQKPNLKTPLDLLKHGKTHECIQLFEQKLPKQAYETIKRHNFFPQFPSEQQDESFNKIKQNVRIYDDPVLQKINQILSGDFNTILEVAKDDWMVFVMLYTQFFKYLVTPEEMTEILKRQRFKSEQDEYLMTLFWKLVIETTQIQIVQNVMSYDLHLTYFLYCYFQAQGEDQLRSLPEIYNTKFLLAHRILNEIENHIKYTQETLFFLKEIVDIINALQSIKVKSNQIQNQFEEILNNKMQGMIYSSNDFTEILNLLNDVNAIYPIDKNQSILDSILQRLFSYDPIQNTDNAIINLIEQYSGQKQMIIQIKQAIKENLSKKEFNPLFKDFLNNFKDQNNGLFESELMTLAFRFGTKLDDIKLTNQIEEPELLIMSISKEFIQNLMKTSSDFKLRIKIILSNLLDQCNDQSKELNDRKDVIRLLIRRL